MITRLKFEVSPVFKKGNTSMGFKGDRDKAIVYRSPTVIK